MRTLITNARVITPYRVLEKGAVLIEDGRIARVDEYCEAPASFDGLAFDAGGLYLAPGFIDTHTHGAGNCDFMDGSLEATLTACRTHMAHGTTSIVPTTLSSDDGELEESLALTASASQVVDNMPNILGSHLEGPYFAPAQNGAQDARYLKLPDPAWYESVLRRFPLIIKWTVAPELEGAMRMGRYLADKGVVASMGHTDATEKEVANAIENGYTMTTHLYNGMSRLTRRNAKMYLGVAESTLLHDEVTAEIIADGCHLPPELLRLIYKCKGPGRICLVTDSMRAAGTNDKVSVLGSIKRGQKVEIEGGVAYMPGRASFGGSVATADRLVRTMYKTVGIPLKECVEMMTLTPAKTIGVSARKGTIAVGKDADIALFDEDIQVKIVMVMGKVWIDQLKRRRQ